MEVFPEDEGEYVCIATNPAGEASTRAYLTVLEPEVFVEEPATEDEPDSSVPKEIVEESVSFQVMASPIYCFGLI